MDGMPLLAGWLPLSIEFGGNQKQAFFSLLCGTMSLSQITMTQPALLMPIKG